MISTAFLCASALVAPPQDSPWPQFLGPNASAVSESPVHSLEFDVDKDLAWQADCPAGSSSPCISGDRLFITGAADGELSMLAFQSKTGEQLWRRTRKATSLGQSAHVDAGSAAPTACTDGEVVAFYFGQYGLVVLDLDGELLWEKELPVPEAAFGIGTSPLIVDDLLILSRDGCPDSSIMAFDKKDGSERWSIPRLGYTFSFGTPFLWKNSERDVLVVAGTQRLKGIDPKTGKELWAISGLTSFICTTPTADKDTLFFAAWSTSDAAPTERNDATWGDFEFTEEELADGRLMFERLDRNGDGQLEVDELPESRAKDAFAFVDGNGDGAIQVEEFIPVVESPKGPGNNIMIAVKPGGSGDISKTHVRWSHRRGLPYVASPLLYKGRVYLAKAGGLLSCLNAKDGSKVFGPERLGDHSEYYATPVGVAGHVLVCSSKGTLFVLRAGDEFEVLRTVQFDEQIHATPAIAGGMVYLRTAERILAFGSSAGR